MPKKFGNCWHRADWFMIVVVFAASPNNFGWIEDAVDFLCNLKETSLVSSVLPWGTGELPLSSFFRLIFLILVVMLDCVYKLLSTITFWQYLVIHIYVQEVSMVLLVIFGEITMIIFAFGETLIAYLTFYNDVKSLVSILECYKIKRPNKMESTRSAYAMYLPYWD